MAKNAAAAAKRPRRVGRIIGGIFKWFFRIVGSLLLVGILTSAIVACYGAVYIKNVVLPQSQVNVQTVTLGQDSVVYYTDSSGNQQELMTLNSGESRVWVDYSDLPDNLINAAVAIEDKRFYQHQGVDWKRTAGAMIGLVTGGSSYGGSTITQQTIKNLTENDAVTVKRKVTEIFQALEYEKTHSKSEIIECYLNIIYLGERCYGVGSAAQAYFGKDVSELDLAECAAIIGITNNPSKYDPLLTSVMTVTNEDGTTSELTHRDANKERQEAILYQMYDQGYITYDEYIEAVNEELQFVDKDAQAAEEVGSTEETTTVWSWYQDALVSEITEDLEEAGYSEEGAKLLLYSGGLKIYTAYDPDIQAIVDSVYQDYSNFDYDSANGQQLQSAITIIDNETGAVVALAGGVGEKSASLTYNRATMAKRQPGSSFKPLAVYAPAIEELGLLPSSVYDDVPYSYDEETDTTWPSNSYKYYNGLMTLHEAVRRSSNAVAVNVLQDLGVDKSYEYLTEKLGFTTLVDSRVAASGKIQTDKALAPLAMGGLTDGVTTLEMAGAYTTFSRGGTYCEPYLYTEIIATDGSTVLSHDGTGEQAFSESTTYYMTQMLQEVVENGTGTAAQIEGMSVAGKTGTTSNNYDRWFCGYTPYYTACVWSGYDNNEQISTTTNVSAVVWQKIMSRIHENLSYAEFEAPGDTRRVTYCMDSGMLPTDACLEDERGGRTETGTFLVGDEPKTDCTVHQMVGVVYTDGSYHLAASGVDANHMVSVLNIARADVSVLGAVPNDYEYTYNYLLSRGYAGSAAYDNYDDGTTDAEEPTTDEADSNNDGGTTTENNDGGGTGGTGGTGGGDGGHTEVDNTGGGGGTEGTGGGEAGTGTAADTNG